MSKTNGGADPDHSPEVAQILNALARIDDPMTRYLISMLIDRLTEQIVGLQKPQESADDSLNASRTKIN